MTKRDPHSDNDLINELTEIGTPAQGGSAGGTLARTVGDRDELKQAIGGQAKGGTPLPTSVNKGDKPRGGDMPNPPNRAEN